VSEDVRAESLSSMSLELYDKSAPEIEREFVGRTRDVRAGKFRNRFDVGYDGRNCDANVAEVDFGTGSVLKFGSPPGPGRYPHKEAQSAAGIFLGVACVKDKLTVS